MILYQIVGVLVMYTFEGKAFEHAMYRFITVHARPI